ncbi:MAG: hypothetical protein ACOY45_00285 [Pseudomonadota bacterium]
MTGGNKAERAPTGETPERNVVEAVPSDAAPANSDWADAGPHPWEEEAEMPPRAGLGWLRATIALLAVAGWLGGMLTLAYPAMRAGMAPVALVQFIAALCVPPALIGILYLLFLRTSRAEARRWGTTARAMRSEAASLERVVATLSRKVDENRRALGEQTTMMMALGDGAMERLQIISSGMGEQARRIEASIQALDTAVTGAEKSVEIVLSSLPRAHEEMRGLSERVDAAGLLASQHAAALDTQLAALTERGREADKVAGGAAERLAAHIARMEATSETAGARLEKVAGDMSSAVDAILDRAAEAVDEARRGIATQGEAMLAMLSANQAALDSAGRDSVEALGVRIAGIEDAIGRIAARLREEQGRGDALIARLSGGIAQVDAEIAALHTHGTERARSLSAAVDTLSGAVGAMAAAMQAGDTTARGVIATAEELLTALDASAREIDETLPQALDRLDARIADSRKVIATSKPDLLALVAAAEGTHDAIEAIAGVVTRQRDMLARAQEALLHTLESGNERAADMQAIVDTAISGARRFAEDAAPQLVDALVRVRETASGAADDARETLARIIPDAERALADAAGKALARVLDDSVQHQLAELAESTEAAVAAAARASERLTQQMVAVAQSTAAIESRIEEARAEQEKADSDGFARRVTLLIEAMNSASIDITKCFSREVADSAWAAYLKGDRGVFTRRAVRLLDGGEARQVLALYDHDDGFRDNVNRYIHDFEAMLRQVLALRDGAPLSVTLLSSDMGKLYVVLAQAIERLRT